MTGDCVLCRKAPYCQQIRVNIGNRNSPVKLDLLLWGLFHENSLEFVSLVVGKTQLSRTCFNINCLNPEHLVKSRKRSSETIGLVKPKFEVNPNCTIEELFKIFATIAPGEQKHLVMGLVSFHRYLSTEFYKFFAPRNRLELRSVSKKLQVQQITSVFPTSATTASPTSSCSHSSHCHKLLAFSISLSFKRRHQFHKSCREYSEASRSNRTELI